MKKRLIAAGLMLAMFTGTAAAVSSYAKTINVEYGVSLSINGQTPTLTDVNGKTVQPFVYDGTTYVPIRAVGEGLGATVAYDEKSNVANLTSSLSEDKLNAMYVISLLKDMSFKLHINAVVLSDPDNKEIIYDPNVYANDPRVDDLAKRASDVIEKLDTESAYYQFIKFAEDDILNQTSAIVSGIEHFDETNYVIYFMDESPYWVKAIEHLEAAEKQIMK